MRFAIALFSAAALVSTAMSAPASNPLAGLTGAVGNVVTDAGNAVQQLEQHYGLDNVDKQLEHLLGATYASLEKILPLKLEDTIHKLAESGASSEAIKALGKGLGMLHLGVPVKDINTFLSKASNGFITNMSKALGVTDLEKSLGLLTE